MKSKHAFTDEEKIKKFDDIFDSCLEEFNGSATEEDWDEHYF